MCRRCRKRQFSKSTRFPPTSSNPRSNNNNFLTPGFQPTEITGDNIGFYHGSTFYDGAPPNVLPILNASPILSPGKYVKQSSWSASSHHHNITKKGTNSGTDAARRLVDARREFVCLMNKELLGGSSNNNNGSEVADVRKIYALTGHGVPSELLSYLIQAVRGWTTSPQSVQQPLLTRQHSSSVIQISFQNVQNSTLLNRDQMQVIHANGTTSKLTNDLLLSTNSDDWEHDFDLYMVVMDRIASRLASFVLQPSSHPQDRSPDVSTTTAAGEDHTNNEPATLGSSGSVITPASLKRWNVTMMKGEALPLSLLPMDRHYNSSGRDTPDGGSSTRRRQQQSPIILTVEWVMKKRSNDCSNIFLRLQDGGTSTRLDDDGRSSRDDDSISLVFDGLYE